MWQLFFKTVVRRLQCVGVRNKRLSRKEGLETKLYIFCIANDDIVRRKKYICVKYKDEKERRVDSWDQNKEDGIEKNMIMV